MERMNGKEYWDERYQSNETGWDLGGISPPLKAYFDQLPDKSLKILIPGAGRAYEAEYLWQMGFHNLYVADISEIAIKEFQYRIKNFPVDQLYIGDFFEIQDKFELIVEQTFFCALPPDLRKKYVLKMHELLHPRGKLVGLLFNKEFDFQGPPFGGSPKEYTNLFKYHFVFKTFENAYNSVTPRHNTELFFIFEKNNLDESRSE